VKACERRREVREKKRANAKVWNKEMTEEKREVVKGNE